MRAIGSLVAHQLLAAWRGWAALVLLIGFAAGVVLLAVAGAQRTDSAYLRFLEASKASDVLVSPVNSWLAGSPPRTVSGRSLSTRSGRRTCTCTSAAGWRWGLLRAMPA